MSAGRKYRRQARQTIWRQPGVEPCAETRAWIGRLIVAHDDPEVGIEEFLALCREWAEYMRPRPETERVEAAMQLQEHIARDLLACPGLRAVGIVRLPRQAGP